MVVEKVLLILLMVVVRTASPDVRSGRQGSDGGRCRGDAADAAADGRAGARGGTACAGAFPLSSNSDLTVDQHVSTKATSLMKSAVSYTTFSRVSSTVSKR